VLGAHHISSTLEWSACCAPGRTKHHGVGVGGVSRAVGWHTLSSVYWLGNMIGREGGGDSVPGRDDESLRKRHDTISMSKT